MSNKIKIILILTIIIIALLLYLIISGYLQQKINFSVKENDIASNNNIITTKAVSLKKLTEDYKKSVKNNLSEYLELHNTEETKNKLLNLIVPAEFKDFHLNLVLALDNNQQSIINEMYMTLR